VPTTLEGSFLSSIQKVRNLRQEISSFQAKYTEAVASGDEHNTSALAKIVALRTELDEVKERLTDGRRAAGLEDAQSSGRRFRLTATYLSEQQRQVEGLKPDWRDIFEKSGRYERNPGPGKNW
jgi:hypothetical protein